MEFSEHIWELVAKAEQALSSRFAEIDRISFENTQKIMDAFREHRGIKTLGKNGDETAYIFFIDTFCV